MINFLMQNFGIKIKRWKGCEFYPIPTYCNNLYKELDFGSFSIFIGKGRNWKGGILK